MENYIGHRAKIGVIIPSTNTAVEYDLQRFVAAGLRGHLSRPAGSSSSTPTCPPTTTSCTSWS